MMNDSTHRRVERTRDILRQQSIDAIIVSSPANRRYLTGFTGSAGSAVITMTDAYFLTDFRYVEQVKAQCPGWTLVEISQGNITSVQDVLKGAGAKEVAIEGAYTSVTEFSQLQETIPGVTWHPITGWIERLRAVKDEGELRTMQQAIDIADRAFEYISSRLVGKTEKSIAFDLETFMRREGAVSHSFSSIVASGENGAFSS